tara:strand:+ start:84 stop:506 length:423 start_codon:yes stop_codon:yes gene_type:complete
MKNYNKFISEQRELLTEKGKTPVTTLSAQMAGLGDVATAADIVSPTHSMGMDRNYKTAYDMKNIMKGLPSVTGIDYSEAELSDLIDNMSARQQEQLRQQITTAQSFNDPKNIENMKTSLTRADIDRNNNTMFTPARGYAN